MIEWTPPPAAKRGRGASKWTAAVEAVRKNPNVWGKIGQVKYAGQASSMAKTYNLKFVTRKAENGMYDLYAICEVKDAS
jgi:hypothetical protein